MDYIFNDAEYKAELKTKIESLKKEKNAVIIAHNYQRDEVQELADYHGDSLALAQVAVRTDARIIVFCGVFFMAESAAILNPEKKVLLPVKEAGCPMADMATVNKLREVKQRYPDAAVVCYVNSSAEIKAESDICCTSSNAIEVVKSLDEKRIIFLPDKNLGSYVKSRVPGKDIILWEGFCPTHMRVSEEDIRKAKQCYPEAVFLAHPECLPEVLKHADAVCSTAEIFKQVKNSSKKDFIIGTEMGMLYRLNKENPDKNFYLPTTHLICANMKLTTLGWILHSLETESYHVTVSKDIAEKAKISLTRMLNASKKIKDKNA